MNKTGLLEWQPAAAEALLTALHKHGGAFDGSEMGVGKTAQALAAIREEDLPTLVVCPAVSVPSWRRMGEHLNVKFSILNYEMIRTGRTPFGEWERPRPKKSEKIFECNSCQQKFKPEELVRPDPRRRCPHHHLGIHCITVKTKPHEYGKFSWHDGIKRLVFDEVHRCAALDSLQCDMLIAAKRQRVPTIGLSATAGDSPLDFRALGYVLGLHSLVNTPSSPGFIKWAFARGVRKHPMGGFHFAAGEERKKEIMAGIHSEIFPERGTRVRIDDLGTLFPEVQITAELYDVKEAGRIDKLYAAMDEAIRLLNDERKLDVAPEHPLTTLLRASQEIELLTVPIFEELTGDALEQGYHVAIFVNYRRTVEELCRRLKTDCRIDGSQVGERGARERAAHIDRFQEDAAPVIVTTSAAGGITVSLQDVRGQFPRVGLVAPGNDARGFKQVFGRLRRATGRSKALYRVILVAGTVQEKIHKALSSKLNCMDALNDADLWAANLPLTRCSAERLFEGVA